MGGGEKKNEDESSIGYKSSSNEDLEAQDFFAQDTGLNRSKKKTKNKDLKTRGVWDKNRDRKTSHNADVRPPDRSIKCRPTPSHDQRTETCCSYLGQGWGGAPPASRRCRPHSGSCRPGADTCPLPSCLREPPKLSQPHPRSTP